MKRWWLLLLVPALLGSSWGIQGSGGSGTGTAVGNWDHTGDASIPSTQMYGHHTNRGASATVKLTLPDAVAGMGEVCFVAAEAEIIQLKPDAGDRIGAPWTNSSGDCLASDGSEGANVCIFSENNDEWEVRSNALVWLDANSC